MDTILIAGVETIAGANLAVHFADRCRVRGSSADERIAIDGAEPLVGEARDFESARRLLLAAQPDAVVHCGPASASAWSGETTLADLTAARAIARNLARGAAERGCRFTFISSDAVFSGPWMFHEEDGASFCPSEEAETIRATENDVLAACPGALVLRTNVFGWSPDPADCGWIERLLHRLDTGKDAGLHDGVAHATPIAAAHLAEIVERAHRERLEGTFHVGGAERVSPAGFARRLAEAFDIGPCYSSSGRIVDDRPVGYGRGETSLQTRKIRKALCVAMPTFAEGLATLLAERDDGRADALRGTSALAHQRVA
ncbi:MAG: sugar nucleotide-binding protein [Planctomycetaceae bacterium]